MIVAFSGYLHISTFAIQGEKMSFSYTWATKGLDLDQSKHSNHVLHCQFAAVTDTVDYIDHTMQKRIFGHIQTAKIHISLRVHALWSRPSLFLLTESLATTACMNGGQKPDRHTLCMSKMIWIWAFCVCSTALFSLEAAHIMMIWCFI